MEQVILVDKEDTQIGLEEKMKAHQEGKLHRAFSVFVFNSKNELMLQQRARDKYHCGGLWSNTCCSHPRLGETVEVAAHRRLVEEMGFDCELEKDFHIIYKVHFDNGLTECEFDHVLIGQSDKLPKINKDEVEDWKYLSWPELLADLIKNEKNYTSWFKLIVPKMTAKF